MVSAAGWAYWQLCDYCASSASSACCDSLSLLVWLVLRLGFHQVGFYPLGISKLISRHIPDHISYSLLDIANLLFAVRRMKALRELQKLPGKKSQTDLKIKAVCRSCDVGFGFPREMGSNEVTGWDLGNAAGWCWWHPLVSRWGIQLWGIRAVAILPQWICHGNPYITLQNHLWPQFYQSPQKTTRSQWSQHPTLFFRGLSLGYTNCTSWLSDLGLVLRVLFRGDDHLGDALGGAGEPIDTGRQKIQKRR